MTDLHESWHLYVFYHPEGLCAVNSVVTPPHVAVQQNKNIHAKCNLQRTRQHFETISLNNS